MEKRKEIKDFGYLGREAQLKIVKALFEDPKLFNEIYPVLDPNYFSEQPLRMITGLFKDYYKEKGLIPSYNAILLLLKQKALSGIEVEEYEEYLETIKKMDTFEIDNNVELATIFCKQQKLVAVANKIIDSVKKGYSANQTLRFANELTDIEANIDDEIMINPLNVIEDVLKEEKEVRVPTGLGELDDVLQGG